MLNKPSTILPLTLSYATLVLQKSKIKPISKFSDSQLFDFCQRLLRLTLISNIDYKDHAEEFRLENLFYSVYPTFIELHQELEAINKLINPNLFHTKLISIDEFKAINLLHAILELMPKPVTV